MDMALALGDISVRPAGDERELNPEHVVTLAESIGALGLLEPLVVDAAHQLLAGGHRLAACWLLITPKEDRFQLFQAFCHSSSPQTLKKCKERLLEIEPVVSLDELRRPLVRVMDFHAAQEKSRALAVEAAENTIRRNYTSKEVYRLYKKLLAAGYTDKRGKPRKGERAAKPEISSIIGRTVRTVERMIEREERKRKERPKDLEVVRLVKLLDKAVHKFMSNAKKFEEHDGLSQIVHMFEGQDLSGLLRRVQNELDGASSST